MSEARIRRLSALLRQLAGDVALIYDSGAAAPATTTSTGLVALSAPPANPDAPVAVAGTDPRLTDARPPTAHTHSVSDLTATGTRDATTVLHGDNTWKVPPTGSGGSAPDATTTSKGVVQLAGDLGGTAAAPTVPGLAGKADAGHTHAELPTSGQKNALAGTSGTPGSTNTYVTNQDARLSDARTPTAHTHTKSQITDFAHTHPASELTATGTRDATTFLRGDNTWAVPAGGAGGGFSWAAVAVQAADGAHLGATTAFQNSDLVFTFDALGKYFIECILLCTAAATTTGFRFALDVSVVVTAVALDFEHQLANTGTLTGGTSIADATAAGLSSGVPTANTIVPIRATGLLAAAATGGTCRLVYGPEVAAAMTLKANSMMRVHKVA